MALTVWLLSATIATGSGDMVRDRRDAMASMDAHGAQRAEQTAAQGGSTARSSITPTYNQLISVGYEFLQGGKAQEGYVAAVEAVRLNAKRFEAYALAALALHSFGDDMNATEFLKKAFERAPEDKKPKLRELARSISEALTSPAPSR